MKVSRGFEDRIQHIIQDNPCNNIITRRHPQRLQDQNSEHFKEIEHTRHNGNIGESGLLGNIPRL
jgi:hypothetical protein